MFADANRKILISASSLTTTFVRISCGIDCVEKMRQIRFETAGACFSVAFV